MNNSPVIRYDSKIDAIHRAISSVRWDDSQRICYVSNDGYTHTIRFGNFYTSKRRNWTIDSDAKPFSTIQWQLEHNADLDSVRLLDENQVYVKLTNGISVVKRSDYYIARA
jgi:hypothetical protein